jgi:hypothetical protein
VTDVSTNLLYACLGHLAARRYSAIDLDRYTSAVCAGGEGNEKMAERKGGDTELRGR